LVLHQKLLHCKGSLTRHVVVVQEPIFYHFAGFFPPPNGVLQTRREFQYKKWDVLCALLCDLRLHFVVPWHCSPTTEIILLWVLMIFISDIPVAHSGFLKSFVSINLIEGIVSFLPLCLTVCKRTWFLHFIGTWKLSQALVTSFCCAANASTVTRANLDPT